MHQDFHNEPAVKWARANLQTPLEIKLLFGSSTAKIFSYALLFITPAAFIVLGIVLAITGVGSQDETRPAMGAFVCGIVLLIPFGVILLVGKLTQAGFATSLDADGVNMSRGRKFSWGKFYYVDHVSKYFRYGTSSRRIRDNQLELIFENGKVIIPPLIFDREKIWALVNTMPVEVRDDGVPRARDTAKNILAAIAELRASAGEVTSATPQPQIPPETSSNVTPQPQPMVEPEATSNLTPELREWLRGPKTEAAVAEYALEILRRHFDPEGLPVNMKFPPWSLAGFADELRSQTYSYVLAGEHKQMLKNMFAELAHFFRSIPGEAYDYRLFVLIRPWLRDSKSHAGLFAVMPIDALVKWDEFQEMLDREFEDDHRRQDQSGY